MSATAKKWILSRAFEGVPALSDFKLEEETVSFDLTQNEIIIEAVYLSVDPYMRLEIMSKPGVILPGEQIARVKASKNEKYPVDTLVLANVGWRTLTKLSDPDKLEWAMLGPVVSKVPDLGQCPISYKLSCLGMPGLTAYFALLDRGKPKAGETVLVSAAAGAVGSVVGQIAKIKGCYVVGSAGSNEKCDWLKELGFDQAFNYKETSVDDALKKLAPKGVDVFFDNVGGDFTSTVIQNHMNNYGRVVVCGFISQYNKPEKVTDTTQATISKLLDILGFQIGFYTDRFDEGIPQLIEWVKEGKLKYRETITEGFDNMPRAFIDLFSGANIGKAVVKV